MKTRPTPILSALLLTALVSAPMAFGQSPDDVASIKKDVEALKTGQQAIQNDLQEIKKLLAARPAAAAAGGPDKAMDAVINVAGEPFKGKKDAKLTLIEFSEYQCPFCGRHVRDTYPTLDKEYVQTGKVKYVFRDLPLITIHKNAFKAAEAGHCAGDQGKFWEMHDRLFQNQKALEPAMLTAHAEAIGLDAKKFQACLDGGKYTEDIKKDMAEAAKYGITGTPTTVIGLTEPNGSTIKVLKVLRGAKALAEFKEALDSLATAKPATAVVEKKAAN